MRYTVRRPIGTFYLLAQKLVFHNSDLSKSTTFCKMGDLEVSPKPFWIWKHIHVHKIHVYEVYAHEVHTYELYAHKVHTHEVHAGEVHAYEMHAYEMHAYEMHADDAHAYEGFCEDLARQNTVAHLS
jgi:hypothetical protein